MVSNLHNTNKDVLDRDLVRIDTSSKQWLVTFSIQKTCDMSLSLRPTAAVPMPLSFFGANLESVSIHKHLGLTFSSDLKWNNHVNVINARADKRLCQLEALRFKLNRKYLEILYISYIRPIVKYVNVKKLILFADIVHGNAPSYLQQDLPPPPLRPA